MLTFDNIKINGKVFYQPQEKQQAFHNAILNRAENGYRDFLYGGAARGGKLIPVDTVIPTPDGYRDLEDIHPGDYVLSNNGYPVQVIWESKIEDNPDAYEITFDTGEKIKADARHLWKTFSEKERTQVLRLSDEFREKRRQNRVPRAKANPINAGSQKSITIFNQTRDHDYLQIPTGTIRTTKELFETQKTKRGRSNHTIALTEPLQLPKANLPIDPYLLGVWLGDGWTGSGNIGMLVEDFEEMINYTNEKVKSKIIDRRKKQPYAKYLIENLTTRLRENNLKGNKHIPTAYLRASYGQRLSLLQGLMDADGYCDNRNQCEIALSDKKLINDVFELVCSLGIKTKINTKKIKRYSDSYRVSFVTDIPVFKLKRKLERQTFNVSKVVKQRTIIKVEKCPPVPMKCIQVANKDGMFLITKSFIPTHNSFALRWEAHRNCLQYPRLRGLLIRSSFPELERTHLAQIGFDLPSEVIRYNSQKHVAFYYNDSVLEFGYGTRREDFKQYLSAEYDFIMIDELTTIPFEFSYLLRSRLTASRKDFIPFWACATNPGDIAHVDVRAYFVRKNMQDAERFPAYNPKEIFFIPATVFDNKLVIERDPGEVTRLKQLSKKDQQKFLYGNWDIFEGQFFDNWNPDVHIVPKKDYLPLEQLTRMNVMGGLDYGNITVLELGAKDYNGNVIIFDELYFERETRGRKIEKTKEFLKERNLLKATIIADTNMWTPDAFDTSSKESPANEYLKEGLRLIPVSKSSPDNRRYRIACNDAIYDALDFERDPETGIFTKQPKIKIYERCKWLCETLPSLITDEKDVEDIEDGQNDHPFDAAKYLYMTLSKPRKEEADTRPEWVKQMQKELKQQETKQDFMAV